MLSRAERQAAKAIRRFPSGALDDYVESLKSLYPLNGMNRFVGGPTVGMYMAAPGHNADENVYISVSLLEVGQPPRCVRYRSGEVGKDVGPTAWEMVKRYKDHPKSKFSFDREFVTQVLLTQAMLDWFSGPPAPAPGLVRDLWHLMNF